MNPLPDPLIERLRSVIARSIPYVTPELAEEYSNWLVTGTVTSDKHIRRYYKVDVNEDSSYLLLIYLESGRHPLDPVKFTIRLEALELLLRWKDENS